MRSRSLEREKRFYSSDCLILSVFSALAENDLVVTVWLTSVSTDVGEVLTRDPTRCLDSLQQATVMAAGPVAES